MNRTSAVALGLAAFLSLAAPAVVPVRPRQTVGNWVGAALAAQDRDVELLGQIHGTRPPETYYQLRARDPRAFQMGRGMAAGRGLPASGARTALLRAGPAGIGGLPPVGRVRGTFHFPVVLGLFGDSPPAVHSRAAVQAHFFDGPNPTGTIPDLYREMSGGMVELVGDVLEWERSGLSQDSVAKGVSGLGGGSRVGSFIVDLLSRLPPSVDWGRYDNDGPDGLPNSGDDDGYVDVLAVLHPTPGAECGGASRGGRVWSHKWSLRSAVGQEFVTGSATPDGGRIRIDDYTIQPVRDCSDSRINEIGVFAHEMGHGFGLPDLYASAHAGAGRWDLMATGSWGCSATYEPERPCHMGAWSKAMLGWIPVDVLPFGSEARTYVLDPAERGGRAVAIPAGDGSGEYFLVENRQRVGFDARLPETGLLVWHVDPWLIEGRLPLNEVNVTAGRMGVWLRQADGLDQLGLSSSQGGNRGDAGDPFTGAGGRAAFHAGTNPAAFTHTRSTYEQVARGLPARGSAGVTLTDIAREGERMRFRALADYRTLTVRGRGETGEGSLFTVDGIGYGAAVATVRSAPYQRHTIEAAPGAPLAEGVRRGFSGWEDAPAEALSRAWTTGLEDAELVAVYGGPREVRVRVGLEGTRFGVRPGTVTAVPPSSDFWFDEGTQVAFRAEPTQGFAFGSWGGAFAGLPNPAVVPVGQPRDATATFDLVFGLDPLARVDLPAATPLRVALVARHANDPVAWTLTGGVLPDGVTLETDGVLTGEALETGTFPVELVARDALGLEASGPVSVRVGEPVFGTDGLAAPFLLRPAALTASQERFLDRSGNGDGAYDLGDFRAYLLAHPDAPAVAPAAAAQRAVPLVDFGAPEGR